MIYVLRILLFLVVLRSPGALLAQSPEGVDAAQVPVPFKVVIDPGHGGEDHGATGPEGLREKDVVLDLALALRDQLLEEGLEVVLTREEDVFIPVWDRARMANEAQADLFVSIHLNASRMKAARGSEVYFLSMDAGDADAAEVAERENLGADRMPMTQDSLLMSILDDMAQKAYLQDSERLAVQLQVQLNHLGGIKERGVKQAPFAVLRGAAMPAALVEVAFISNPREEARLKSPDFRTRITHSMAHGILRFFATVEATPRRKPIDPVTAGGSKNGRKPS